MFYIWANFNGESQIRTDRYWLLHCIYPCTCDLYSRDLLYQPRQIITNPLKLTNCSCNFADFYSYVPKTNWQLDCLGIQRAFNGDLMGIRATFLMDWDFQIWFESDLFDLAGTLPSLALSWPKRIRGNSQLYGQSTSIKMQGLCPPSFSCGPNAKEGIHN